MTKRFRFLILLIALFVPNGNGNATRIHSPEARLVISMPDEISIDAPQMPRAAETWLAMIHGAHKTIDIAQFYVNSDTGSPLEPVISEIEAAIKRGVVVRFLLSDASLSDTATLDRLRAIRGLKLRRLDLEHRNGGVLHAKYWIIDGKISYVGSQNFDWKSLTQIQEFGVEVKDRAIARQLGRIFDADWRLAATAPRNVKDREPMSTIKARSGDIELVASPPRLNPSGIRSALRALVELIGSADSSISVQLLSYSPVADKTHYWSAIDGALRAAAVRGVKVRLLVSHWNTAAPGVDHLKSLSLVPHIEVRIVTFPDRSSGFIPFARVIHSKYMVVDSATLWVGTSNWSRDYFKQMRNVELIFSRPSLAVEAGGFFNSIWNSPYATPIDVIRIYPKPRRG